MPVKRKGAFYHYDFTINGTRFRGSTKAKTAAEAKKIESNLYRSAVTGKTILTLSQAFGKYWSEHASSLPSADNIDYQSKRLLEGLGENKLIAELETREISAYIARRRLQVSNSSVNREITLLRAVMNRCEAVWGFTISDINWGSLFLKEPPHRVKYLKKEEAEKLLKVAHKDLKPIILLALHTGLRKSNCLNLKWEDVDLRNRTITVKVKGDKYHTVYLNPDIFIQLANMPRRPKVFDTTNFRRRWATALKKAGLKIRFHDLRHTAATWMVQDGASLVDVKKAMGHEDIKTTLRYAHVSEESVRAAFDKIASHFGHSGEEKSGKSLKNKVKSA